MICAYFAMCKYIPVYIILFNILASTSVVFNFVLNKSLQKTKLIFKLIPDDSFSLKLDLKLQNIKVAVLSDFYINFN